MRPGRAKAARLRGGGAARRGNREVDFQRSGWLQEGIILECSSHTGGRLRILNLDTGSIDWLSFDVVWTCYDPTYPCPPRRRKEFEDKETVG